MLARRWHDRLLRPHAGAGHQGLAFLPWSNSPHHDVEEQRRPLIHRLIARGTLPDGYATENGTGLVFFGTELQDAFTEVEGKVAYSLTQQRGETRGSRWRPGCSEQPAAAQPSGGGAGPVGSGVHGVRVGAGAQQVAGDGAGEGALTDDLGPVHQDVPHADGVGVQAAGAPRQVVAGSHGAVADGGRVEDDHVGEGARDQAAAVAAARRDGPGRRSGAAPPPPN